MVGARIYSADVLESAAAIVLERGRRNPAKYSDPVVSDALVSVAACLPPRLVTFCGALRAARADAVPDSPEDLRRMAHGAARLALRNALTDHSRRGARLASLDSLLEGGADDGAPIIVTTGEGDAVGRLVPMSGGDFANGPDYAPTDADRLETFLTLAADGDARVRNLLEDGADAVRAWIADRMITRAPGVAPGISTAAALRDGRRPEGGQARRDRDVMRAALSRVLESGDADLILTDPCGWSTPMSRTLPVSRRRQVTPGAPVAPWLMSSDVMPDREAARVWQAYDRAVLTVARWQRLTDERARPFVAWRPVAPVLVGGMLPVLTRGKYGTTFEILTPRPARVTVSGMAGGGRGASLVSVHGTMSGAAVARRMREDRAARIGHVRSFRGDVTRAGADWSARVWEDGTVHPSGQILASRARAADERRAAAIARKGAEGRATDGRSSLTIVRRVSDDLVRFVKSDGTILLTLPESDPRLPVLESLARGDRTERRTSLVVSDVAGARDAEREASRESGGAVRKPSRKSGRGAGPATIPDRSNGVPLPGMIGPDVPEVTPEYLAALPTAEQADVMRAAVLAALEAAPWHG